MSKSMKWWLCVIIIPIILAYPTWHYFLRDKLYVPGPSYYVQIDQKLKTILDVSKISENLAKYYEFDITEPALDLMLKEGIYESSGSFKFIKNYKRKTYVSLLDEILSRNEDKIEYDINEEAKVIFIRPKK